MDNSKLLIIKNSDNYLHHPHIEIDEMTVKPHQEQPQRVENIERAIIKSNLPVSFSEIHSYGEDIVKDIHTAELINSIKQISMDSDETEYNMPYVFGLTPVTERRSKEIKRVSYHCMDMGSPIGKYTYQTALLSASISYEGARRLIDGQKYIYGLCRPPGHHAENNVYGGYCYFNNAGVAANHFIKSGKSKVAILDVDYHHGNGTQRIFYDTDAVLYVSIHGDPDLEYPYYTGFDDETGSGKGLGANLNMPLPIGTDEERYLKALNRACEKILSFKPDVLILSLGLDTYKRDPICRFILEVETYEKIAKKIKSLNYPTLVLQEGGYCVPDLGKLAVSFFKGYLEDLLND